MPYRLEPDDNRCMQQQTPDGSWERMMCHDSVAEAQAHLTALQINVDDATKDTPMTAPDNEKRIYFGSAVKALGNGIIEGQLIAFTDERIKDLHKEYFSKRTNLHASDYPIEGGLGVLYQHGMDETIGIKKIGRVLKSKIDDAGVWIQAQLDLADEYQEMIYDLAQSGKLGWSSGALPQSVKVSSDGHIDEWAVIEASVTPNPAMPYATQIHTAKFLKSIPTATAPKEPNIEAKEVNADSVERGDGNTQAKPDNQLYKGFKMNEEMREMVREIVMAVLEESKGMYEDEKMNEEEIADAVAMDMDEEEVKAMDEEEVAKSVASKAMALVIAQIEKRNKARETAKAVAKQSMSAYNVRNGAKTGDYLPAGGGSDPSQTRLSVKTVTAYDHWTPEDFSFALDVAQKSGSLQQPLVTANIFDKAYFNQFADKAIKAHETGQKRLSHAGIKAVNAIKADELDYTTQVGFGDEWVFTNWTDSIWDKPRLDLVYNQLQVTEMTSNPYEIPTENSDPTVYFVPETQDEAQLTRDSSNSPIPDSKIGTSKVQLNAKKLALRSSWSAELDEDAIGTYLPKFRQQATRAIEDAIELVSLLGDTSASGNINDDGGTPAATERYRAFDGILHQALVTATSNAVDNGGASPTLANIRQIRSKLGNAQGYNPANLAIFTDFPTYMKLLSIDAVVTMDKIGSQATVLNGSLGQIDGINVFVSGQMALADTDGKITNGGNVTDTGRLVMTYLPDWYLGYRRRVTSYLNFIPYADAWELVMTARVALSARSYSSAGAQQASDDSVALLYNIGV